MKTEKGTKLAGKLWAGFCLLVLCVNLIALALNLGDRIPFGLLAVDSGSMEPVLSRGDLLVIHETPYEDLAVGDNVTFHNGQTFVTHRLVEKAGETFITQGLANELADLVPMGRSSYCGKVVAAIPLLGWPVRLVNASPLAALLLAVLVGMLCLGQPVLEQLYQQKILGREPKFAAPMAWVPRVLTWCAAVSLLLTMPALTEAKYLTQLKRYETILAQPLYFSSNYLSEDSGNTYSIQGWTGKPYALSLEVRNYDNVLLYNDTGMELNYGIAVEILNDTNNYYTVELKELEEYEGEDHDHGKRDDFPYPAEWTAKQFQDMHNHIIPGGEAHKRGFNIIVKPKDGHEPAEGEMVSFVIHACTARDATYFKELKGTFRFQVTAQNEFLGAKTVDDNGTVVTLTQLTNVVNDGTAEGEKLVRFRWDPKKLYINEYQRTAFNAIHNQTVGSDHYSKDAGLLHMRLQAYSKIELEFFKKEDTGNIGPDDFVVQVVKSIGDPLEDPNPPETTAPPSGNGEGT